MQTDARRVGAAYWDPGRVTLPPDHGPPQAPPTPECRAWPALAHWRPPAPAARSVACPPQYRGAACSRARSHRAPCQYDCPLTHSVPRIRGTTPSDHHHRSLRTGHTQTDHQPAAWEQTGQSHAGPACSGASTSPWRPGHGRNPTPGTVHEGVDRHVHPSTETAKRSVRISVRPPR